MLDDGGHSFTWPSAPVNVLDWLQDHCCDRNMSAVGDFHWTVTPRLWFWCHTRRKDEQLSSGSDPCWQPIWIIQIGNNFLCFTGRFGAWFSEISVWLSLPVERQYMCLLVKWGFGAITTASVNLTFKFHSGLEAPVPKILKQQYIPYLPDVWELRLHMLRFSNLPREIKPSPEPKSSLLNWIFFSFWR